MTSLALVLGVAISRLLRGPRTILRRVCRRYHNVRGTLPHLIVIIILLLRGALGRELGILRHVVVHDICRLDHDLLVLLLNLILQLVSLRRGSAQPRLRLRNLLLLLGRATVGVIILVLLLRSAR